MVATRMRNEDVDAVTNETTGAIIDAAVHVHRALGPGLLESTYQACLAQTLRSRGHDVREEVVLGIELDGFVVEKAYRLDMLVDHKVVVEVKAVEDLHKVHFAQLRTYLKRSGHRVGLLINFDAVPVRSGLHRIVL